MSEPAYETNCPGAAARRTSIAGAPVSSTSSVCSIITTASAPRGTTPPVAMVVAVPGVTVERRRMAAHDDFAIEREPARRGVGRAGEIGGAQRKAVDIGAVERRHVDRRQHVVRQHAAERRGDRNAFRGQRRQIEMARKSRTRFVGGDDFEELLLPRRAAHGGDQLLLGLFPRWGTRPVAHGHALITTSVPGG